MEDSTLGLLFLLRNLEICMKGMDENLILEGLDFEMLDGFAEPEKNKSS